MGAFQEGFAEGRGIVNEAIQNAMAQKRLDSQLKTEALNQQLLGLQVQDGNDKNAAKAAINKGLSGATDDPNAGALSRYTTPPGPSQAIPAPGATTPTPEGSAPAGQAIPAPTNGYVSPLNDSWVARSNAQRQILSGAAQLAVANGDSAALQQSITALRNHDGGVRAAVYRDSAARALDADPTLMQKFGASLQVPGSPLNNATFNPKTGGFNITAVDPDAPGGSRSVMLNRDQVLDAYSYSQMLNDPTYADYARERLNTIDAALHDNIKLHNDAVYKAGEVGNSGIAAGAAARNAQTQAALEPAQAAHLYAQADYFKLRGQLDKTQILNPQYGMQYDDNGVAQPVMTGLQNSLRTGQYAPVVVPMGAPGAHIVYDRDINPAQVQHYVDNMIGKPMPGTGNGAPQLYTQETAYPVAVDAVRRTLAGLPPMADPGVKAYSDQIKKQGSGGQALSLGGRIGDFFSVPGVVPQSAPPVSTPGNPLGGMSPADVGAVSPYFSGTRPVQATPLMANPNVNGRGFGLPIGATPGAYPANQGPYTY